MATVDKSGLDWLEEAAASISELPFATYLTIGTLTDEAWSTIQVDDEASSGNWMWKSSEGSVIKDVYTSSGTEEKGSEKGTVSVNSKNSGIKIDGNWNSSWGPSSSNDQQNISFTFTGDTTTKEDDYSYRYTFSEQDKWSDTSSGSNGTWAETQRIELSNFIGSYKASFSGSGSWTYDNALDSNTTDKKNTTFSYAFINKQDNISLSMAGKIAKDIVADQVKLDISAIKYTNADYAMTTAKFSKIMTIEENDALPNIGEDAGDFDTISSNIMNLVSIFFDGDNTIVITSKEGKEIDAGTGNDRVTGGIGNDAIIAGAGRDTLAGGKGNDIFILSKEDYDFTSSKTLLVDTITDFKYITNGEQDTITLEGFSSIETYKTIADAKKAASEAEVIYESSTGKFWYNEDMDSALVGVMNFATAKGIPLGYDWAAASTV
jgi:Ca2+-binding RTX toxin-like protein